MNKRLSTAIWTAVVALLLAAAGSYLMYLAVTAARSCTALLPANRGASKQIPYALYSIGGLAFAGFAVSLGFSIYNAVKYGDERRQMQQMFG